MGDGSIVLPALWLAGIVAMWWALARRSQRRG